MSRIPLDELTVGMYVVGLDRPWLQTPFLRHRMWIATEDQIRALRDSGVRFVEIDADKGPGPAVRAAGGEPPPRPGPAPEPSPPPAAEPGSFADELPLAMKAYREAKVVVQRVLYEARMGRALSTEAVHRVVDGLVDSVLRNEDALTSLSRLKCYDEYTFFHSVNTAVLALALGRSLGWDRDRLRGLGTGALLHDAGKMMIPLEILNKPDRLVPHEFEVMKQHALRGAELLARTTGLEESAIRPALEHHERVNGGGYPFGRTRERLTEIGLISSVVDVYDAVTSDRVYHRAMPPHEALRFLFSLGRKGHLDAVLVERFIKALGIYPVGSCVLLTGGETAVVEEIRRDQPLRPKVRVVRDAQGRALRPAVPLDLGDQAESRRTIVAVVDPAEMGIDPDAVLGRPAW